ncbi:hypothetical protein KIN20_021545 [Parelaphostrongylus tenuis]|uniref:Ig-like domain-containing protein n=1 Tax=Parelaphostrongylus tenuis TaxID=148309 RepID=A0AAD5MP25_PARTN|nr:hypothetical protein KIN20_021545 [Parelaphostrongylus tenuis]
MRINRGGRLELRCPARGNPLVQTLYASQLDQMPDPIIDQPYNTTVRVRHTAQFLCKAKSTQSPLIKWLKEIEDPMAIRHRDPNETVVNASGINLLVLKQTQVESVSRGADRLYTNRLVIPTVDKLSHVYLPSRDELYAKKIF